MKTLAKSVLVLLAAITLWLIVTLPKSSLSAPSSNWYVATTGSGLGSCGSISEPCISIDTTIGKAYPGDTIYVAAGTYTEDKAVQVTIRKDIHLSGGWNSDFSDQHGYSNLDGSGLDPYTSRTGVIVEQGVHALIERMVIQNIPDSMSYYDSNTGLYNQGDLYMDDCQIVDNHARDTGGGVVNSGVITITNSIVSGNTSGIHHGGGIVNQGKLTLTHVTISDNIAATDGGGIASRGQLASVTIQDSVIRNNIARNGWFGGGIFNDSGRLTIINSIIEGNRAEDWDSLEPFNNGGGIHNRSGELLIEGSVLRNNFVEGSGGAIYTESSQSVTISNSTISQNHSTLSGGGIHNEINLSLYNVTISYNQSQTEGGGIYNRGDIYQQGIVNIQNSILAENTAGNAPDCWGELTTSGYNIVGRLSGCSLTSGDGDIVNVNPQIGLLVDYLGYNPLSPTSPAIDAGNPAGCLDENGNPLLIDQRSAPRQGRCDIVAYEYLAPEDPAVMISIAGSPQSTFTNEFFPENLGVLVTDEFGSPTGNVTVTFNSPSSGPGLTFSDSGTNTSTYLTDLWGMAVTSNIKANESPGEYTVRATAGAAAVSTGYQLTNIGRVYVPATTCRYCTDFSDDFSYPQSGWPVVEDDTVLAEYIEGEYRVLGKESDYLYLFGAPTCEHQNFIVETDVRWGEDQGDSYGIVFGIIGNFEQFYLFNINVKDGYYMFYHFNGTDFFLIDTEQSDAIQRGTKSNHIMVTRNGNNIEAEINGMVIENWPGLSNPGLTSVGILVTTSRGTTSVGDARFDNFKVTGLPDTVLPGNFSTYNPKTNISFRRILKLHNWGK